ncbi:hypothetical protein E2C01_079887 [Portunus trituberculatus]|uniref:Uncharacterized protein n=1 Tax=Portunus trituberculatus TaxID=210409 RepID=A0A5B7IUI3_PORTR|nr:hypothetical protein [Portunus trituberculatus]
MRNASLVSKELPFNQKPVGILEEYVGSAVKLLPISGTSSFIYSGTHNKTHITTRAHLWCNHPEPVYHGDM